MKQVFIRLILFLSVIQITGQNNPYLVEEWGMVKFGDTILIDYTEITCGEYLDFLYYQNLNDFKNYLLNKNLDESEISLLKKVVIKPDLLPDAQILKTLPYNWLFEKCEACSGFVFQSVASIATVLVPKDSMITKTQINRIHNLLNLPIVGLSFEQAMTFCNWRTKRDKLVNRLRYAQQKLIEYDTTGLIYALPSPSEFDLMNPSKDSISTKKGRSNYNYKNAFNSTSDPQNLLCGRTIMKAQSFEKFKLHSLVDIQGNVAEMTSLKGVSKGGSYLHYASETLKGKEIIYNKPERWLGFRCVAKLDKNGY